MRKFIKRPIKASNRPAPRRRAIKSAYENYEISDSNKFSEFLGAVENALDSKIQGAEGTYDILGTQFVEDYGYQYEIIIRDCTDRPKEITYITIDYTKGEAGGVYAWRGDDEETTFATGKTLDDIVDDVAGQCAVIIEDYENFQ